MMDLLNLPINERALESLLAGDWQVWGIQLLFLVKQDVWASSCGFE